MSSRLSEPGRTLFELLADGRWHPVSEVIVPLARVYPPGMAIRFAERARHNQRATRQRAGKSVREDSARARPATTEAIVLTGQRGLATKLIGEWLRTGYVVADTQVTRQWWRTGNVRATQAMLDRHRGEN